MSKIYVLQKDLPTTKKGIKFIRSTNGNVYEAEDQSDFFKSEIVENSPEWFKEEEKIEVISDQFDTVIIRRGNRGISVEFDKLFDLVQKYYNAPEKFEIKYTEQDMRECFRNSRRMKSPFHTSEFTWDSFDHYMSFVKQPKYKIPPQHE